MRATTAGSFDPSKFDPWDTWCWKKLRWTLEELESQHHRDAARVQHNHWVTLASHSRLAEESFDMAKTNAGTAFNRYLKATYPWLADEIGESGTHNEREHAVSEYHEIFGKPGEPKYEAMVDTLYKALKKGKMTPREKDKARKARRARRREELEARIARRG